MPARARRKTTTQAGLGYAHQKARAAALAAFRDGTPCPYCPYPMYRWQALELDHVIPRALGGISGPVRLAHAVCNRRAGGRIGGRIRARQRAQQRKWVTSRNW
jgi:5-methylcytosine-specific restriction endonuclease McrA